MQKLANDFAQTFITKDRWQLFAKGFTVTIRVAILALLMGIAIGVLVAIVRTKHDSRKKNAHGFGNVILNILKCNLSGLSDHYPGNPYDGSADDHVFRSIFIQPT